MQEASWVVASPSTDHEGAWRGLGGQEVGISPPGPRRRGGERPCWVCWELRGEVLHCYKEHRDRRDIGLAERRFHRHSASSVKLPNIAKLHRDCWG